MLWAQKFLEIRVVTGYVRKNYLKFLYQPHGKSVSNGLQGGPGELIIAKFYFS